jgi:hypothetical protein
VILTRGNLSLRGQGALCDCLWSTAVDGRARTWRDLVDPDFSSARGRAAGIIAITKLQCSVQAALPSALERAL